MAHFYSGRDGELRHNGNTIAKVASFSIQSSLETLEVTTLGDNDRRYIPGVVGYSGSATLLYYEDSNGKIAAGEVLKRIFTKDSKGVTTDAKKEMEFRFKGGKNGDTGRSIKIKAYITSASIAAATGDIMRAEIAFQGDGTLVEGQFD